MKAQNRGDIVKVAQEIVAKITTQATELAGLVRTLEELNPEKVLARGYALVKGEMVVGSEIEIIKEKQVAKAQIKEIKER